MNSVRPKDSNCLFSGDHLLPFGLTEISGTRDAQ